MSHEAALFKLAEVIVGAGGQASIAFSSIPASYKHLHLLYQVASDTGGQQDLRMQLNSDTGSHYAYVVAQDYASSAGTTSLANPTTYMVAGYMSGPTSPSGTSGSGELWLPNYSATVFHKQISGAGGWNVNAQAQVYGEWLNTAAITSILLFPASGNFVQGSVASLYALN